MLHKSPAYWLKDNSAFISYLQSRSEDKRYDIILTKRIIAIVKSERFDISQINIKEKAIAFLKNILNTKISDSYDVKETTALIAKIEKTPGYCFAFQERWGYGKTLLQQKRSINHEGQFALRDDIFTYYATLILLATFSEGDVLPPLEFSEIDALINFLHLSQHRTNYFNLPASQLNLIMLEDVLSQLDIFLLEVMTLMQLLKLEGMRSA